MGSIRALDMGQTTTNERAMSVCLWKKQKIINNGNIVPETLKGKQHRRKIGRKVEEKNTFTLSRTPNCNPECSPPKLLHLFNGVGTTIDNL
jgi:hypothetical protein